MRCLSVRPSVCLSVMFIHSVKTNKHTFKFFSPSGSHTIPVFPCQMSWRYSDEDPPNGGVEFRWGRQKSQFWAYIWLHRALSNVNAATARCCQHGAAGLWQVVTLYTYSCKRRSLLMAGDDDEMFMTRSLSVMPKTTEQHFLLLRSDKSVAYVTNNKRLRSTFCTIEANYWQTRSRATRFHRIWLIGALCGLVMTILNWMRYRKHNSLTHCRSFFTIRKPNRSSFMSIKHLGESKIIIYEYVKPERNGRTDGQTDRIAISISR